MIVQGSFSFELMLCLFIQLGEIFAGALNECLVSYAMVIILSWASRTGGNQSPWQDAEPSEGLLIGCNQMILFTILIPIFLVSWKHFCLDILLWCWQISKM